MNPDSPYGVIKKLNTFISRHSAHELQSFYNDLRVLNGVDLSALKGNQLLIYFKGLFNFCCLGIEHIDEWCQIFSEDSVIESYQKEFIDHEGYEECFREAIDAQLHVHKKTSALRNISFIDDDTYDQFLEEIDKSRARESKENPHWETESEDQATTNIPEPENAMMEELAKPILRYLHKAKRIHEKSGRKIEEFYIEVVGEKAALEITATEYWEDEDEYENEEDRSSESDPIAIKPTHAKVINLVKRIPRLFLRGNPGTGKSTSLKKIFYENVIASIQEEKQAKIPILIEAKSYLQRGDFVSFILKSFDLGEEYLDALMSRNDLLIMIDGLNEIRPDQIENARGEIKELLESYPSPSIIITSRRYNFETYRIEDSRNLGLKIYDIRPLDETEIRNYIGKRTKNEKEKGKRIWAQIKRNVNIRTLANNPMYLQMILTVAKGDKGRWRKIPQSKGELYHKFMSLLLEWEAKQQSSISPRHKVHQRTKLRYIAFLAYNMIIERTIPEEKVIAILDQKINDYNSSILFLEELKNNYLVKHSETGNLSFIHDSYAEYFAAIWLNNYFKVENELPIDIGEQQWFESILMCSDIFRNPSLLFKFLSYLLVGGKRETLPKTIELERVSRSIETRKGEFAFKHSVSPGIFNIHLSVGCSVAYNILKKTNRANKEKYFNEAEKALSNYLIIWLNHYENTAQEIIPVRHLFAAIGALSSRNIFEKVFCSLEWMTVWGKLSFYPMTKNRSIQDGYGFTEKEKEKLDVISRSSLNAFIDNLNNFAGFYFFLVKYIPENGGLNKIFAKQYDYLKGKLLSDTAKSNIELLKYFFKTTQDYTVLKKVGERDIGFYLRHVQKLALPEDEVMYYLRRHPLLDIDIKYKLDRLESLEEKIQFLNSTQFSKDGKVSDLLATAQEFLATKKYNEAKKFFLQALSYSPTNAASLSFLIRYYKRTGKYQEGIKVLKKAESAGGSTGFIISSIGDLYQKKGDHRNAIRQFHTYADKFGESPYVLLRFAVNYLKMGDADNANLYLSKLMEYETLPPRYYGTIGDIYKKLGQIDKAIDYFERCLIMDSKNKIIWGNLGDCYTSMGKTQEGLDAFTREYNLDTNNINSIVRIADCNLRLGHDEKALEWFAKAEALDDRNPRVLSSLANYYKRNGDIEKAIHYLDRIVAHKPQDAISRHNLANCYKRVRDYRNAIIHLERYLVMEPEDSISFSNLADCYKKIGDLDNAIKYLSKCLTLDPDNTLSIGFLADCYKKQGNYEKAIELLASPLMLQSRNVPALNNLASCYRRIGDFEHAIQHLLTCVEIEPENAISLGNLADCYKKSGDIPQAIKYFLIQIELEPENIISLNNLASCYKKIGDYINAANYLEKHVALEPDNHLSLGNLADCYYRLNNFPRAIIYYKLQVQLQPDNILSMSSLASCYRKLGQYKKEQEVFGKSQRVKKNRSRRYFSRLVERLKTEATPEMGSQDLVRLVLNSLTSNQNFRKILKSDGINISVVRQLINAIYPEFNLLAFGYVRFNEFLVGQLKDTELGVFESPTGELRLGLKEFGIKGMRLAAEVPELVVHSLDGYMKIMENHRPKIVIPEAPIMFAVSKVIGSLEFESLTFEALMESIQPQLPQDTEVSEIRKTIHVLIQSKCLVSQGENPNWYLQQLSLREECKGQAENMISRIRALALKNLAEKLNEPIEADLIDSIF